MKKQLTLALVFIILINSINAQINLVPNPSFEMDSLCPNGFSQISYSPPWFNVNYSIGSADYYNGCAGNGVLTVGTPQNWLGCQIAKSGVAYAGIFAYDYSTGANYEVREYIEVPLDSALIAGRKYCISLYLNLATPPVLTYNKVAITEIGMRLSDTIIIGPSNNLLTLAPQIVSPPGVFLNDTANWMQVSGTYTAHGGERYIVIGNFKPFGQTDTIGVVNTSSNLNQAYYFIDDVSVVDCTNASVEELGNENNVSVMPNPSEGVFQVSSFKFQIESVKVVNVLGEAVNSEQVTGNNVTIDLTGFSRGVYFVEVVTEKGVVRKKVIKE